MTARGFARFTFSVAGMLAAREPVERRGVPNRTTRTAIRFPTPW